MTICALTPEQEAIYDSAWNDAITSCAEIADREATRWREIAAQHVVAKDGSSAARAAAREHSAASIADAIRAQKT